VAGRNGRRTAILKGHEHDVFSLVFSPCGKMLVSAGQDGKIKPMGHTYRKEIGTCIVEFAPIPAPARKRGDATSIDIDNVNRVASPFLLPIVPRPGRLGQLRNSTNRGTKPNRQITARATTMVSNPSQSAASRNSVAMPARPRPPARALLDKRPGPASSGSPGRPLDPREPASLLSV